MEKACFFKNNSKKNVVLDELGCHNVNLCKNLMG